MNTIQELIDAQEALNKISTNITNSGSQPWSESLVVTLSLFILVFTLFALLFSSILLWQQKARASETLKVFGLILILGFSTLLLITGFSNEQLTPIVGLFGAISGYLLGKDNQDNNQRKDNPTNSDPPVS